MLLTIDVGNTHTVLGLFEGPTLRHHWRVRTDPRGTADEYGLLMRELLGAVGTGLPVGRGGFQTRPYAGRGGGDAPSVPLAGIGVCSVVPALNQVLDTACRTYLQVTPLLIGPGVATGMPVLYDTPHQLGSDRLANAVAAFARTRTATIVVDLGTATKFEYVSPRGEYVGGAIGPGLGIAADALFERAARLYRVELAKPGRVLGRNTVHAIQSGLVYGYVALVEGMVQRIRVEQPGPARVIATGGFAALVASESGCIDEIDEFLTLDGVRLIYERNSAH